MILFTLTVQIYQNSPYFQKQTIDFQPNIFNVSFKKQHFFKHKMLEYNIIRIFYYIRNVKISHVFLLILP